MLNLYCNKVIYLEYLYSLQILLKDSLNNLYKEKKEYKDITPESSKDHLFPGNLLLKQTYTTKIYYLIFLICQSNNKRKISISIMKVYNDILFRQDKVIEAVAFSKEKLCAVYIIPEQNKEVKYKKNDL